MLQEGLAILAVMQRRDALLDRQEALALLERQQLVVHLGLPEVAPLVPGDHPFLLEQLAQRGHPGLADQDVLLLLVQRAEQLPHRLGGALDRFLEDRNAPEGGPLEPQTPLPTPPPVAPAPSLAPPP